MTVMTAVADTTKNIGINTANIAVKSISGVLDGTASGLSFLSALVKGDKKIKVCIEKAVDNGEGI